MVPEARWSRRRTTKDTLKSFNLQMIEANFEEEEKKKNKLAFSLH